VMKVMDIRIPNSKTFLDRLNNYKTLKEAHIFLCERSHDERRMNVLKGKVELHRNGLTTEDVI